MIVTPKGAPAPAVEPVRQADTIVGTNGVEPIAEVKAAEDEALSPKFAALARKEKALRAEAQRLKAEKDQMKIKESEYQNSFIPKSKLKEAAIEALKGGQLSYDELTQAVLDTGSQLSPEIMDLRSENAQLRSRLDNIENDAKERQSTDYQQALKQIKADVESLVTSDPYYETIRAYGMVDDVVKEIEDTFKEDGVIMTPEQAAKRVEDRTFEEAKKLLSLEKFKKSFQPEAPKEEPKKPDPRKEQPLKTLSHGTTSAAKPMSARDRAIAAFKGQQIN